MLTEHGEVLKAARNELVAHSDLEVRVNSISPGRQREERRAVRLPDDLEEHFDAAGAGRRRRSAGLATHFDIRPRHSTRIARRPEFGILVLGLRQPD